MNASKISGVARRFLNIKNIALVAYFEGHIFLLCLCFDNIKYSYSQFSQFVKNVTLYTNFLHQWVRYYNIFFFEKLLLIVRPGLRREGISGPAILKGPGFLRYIIYPL